MQPFVIITTGRSGSDYLQACLDSVEGVMTFSGKFDYHKYFKNSVEKKDKKILVENFLNDYENLFGYDYIEQIDKRIDKGNFKENFLNISQHGMLNRKDFILNLYKSYHLTLGRKLENVKAFVHHAHSVYSTIQFLEDFPDSKILVTIRDPRANLKSGLKNWFDFDNERIHMEHVYNYLFRIRDDLRYVFSIKNEKLFIKLEEANNLETKNILCKFLNINFDKKIMTATIASIPWHGDRLSKEKSIKGEYILSAQKDSWKSYFKLWEINFLNILYKDYQMFNYKFKKVYFREKLALLFLVLLPFSFEKQTFSNKKLNFKKKISNIIYYLKRVIKSEMAILRI